MRSLCLFASYYTSAELPYYISVYLKELKLHFTEVVLLTTQSEISAQTAESLEAQGIVCFVESNGGFDFGLWHKALQRYDIASYDKVAFVNDSCILFAPLGSFMAWCGQAEGTVLGMTRSTALAPHIQSYFLVIRAAALPAVKDYFASHGVLARIEDVIRVYEVGMCSYLSNKGFLLQSYIDNGGYEGEFSPYYHCVAYHLSQGIPLIKKKIMFSSYRRDELFTLARMNFNISVSYYVNLILKYNRSLILDLNKLLESHPRQMSLPARMKYRFTAVAIRWLRPFKKLFAHA